jgi:3-deoxy-D-manno-octulosonic-acid transferase
MTILYNIGIRIYYMLILIASTFNNKASLWIKGRHGVLGEIRQSLNANEKNAWFHVSSLGEFEQGRPIMEQFKKHYPEYKIILTFFRPRATRSGKIIQQQILSVIYRSTPKEMPENLLNM